jgi:hypothetical protein
MKLLTQNNNLIEPNYLIHDIKLRKYNIVRWRNGIDDGNGFPFIAPKEQAEYHGNSACFIFKHFGNESC